MRLTEINIERFRIWRDLLLRLNPTGLNVIYGPNEAGKTTLMSFVRSVLFGFEPMNEELSWRQSRSERPWAGAIRCEQAGDHFRIARRAQPDGPGILKLSGPDPLPPADAGVDQLLGGISEAVYRDIFAVGVRELHQLATLTTDQVSEYIYGISLGPKGRQILNALNDVRAQSESLLHPQGQTGLLPDLFERYAAASGRRRDGGAARTRHSRLVRRRRELTRAIEELQTREASARNELRGLRFLQTCHKPWSRSRQLAAQLSQIPVVHGNPDEALQLIDECDRSIRQCTAQHDKLTEQAEHLEHQAARLPINTAFEQQRYAIQTLTSQTNWLKGLLDGIQQAEQHAAELQMELTRQLRQLGEDWTVERLSGIDMSPAAHHELLTAARSYQTAQQRRSRLLRWNRGLSRRSQDELVALHAELDALSGSVEECIAAEQQRMQELEHLTRLRLQEEQLALKIQTVRRVMGRVQTEESIPPWVDKAVNAMWWVGTALFLFGIFTFALGGDAQRSLGGALAAAAFGFAGMMWWGVRNGLRNHFDRKTGIQLDDLAEEARQADRQLLAIQERVENMALTLTDAAEDPESSDAGTSTSELVTQMRACSHRISDLESLARREARAAARRNRLRTLRDRFRTAQAALADERRNWCRVLSQIGLNETVKVEQAFDWWQRIQQVRDVHTEWRNAAPEVEGLRRMVQGMQERVEQVGRTLDDADDIDFSRPLEVLSVWKQQLGTHDRDKAECERLREEARERRRDATHLQHQREAAELRRAAVLSRCGAGAVEEVRQQQEWLRQREELESQKQSADEELNEIALAETELAIAEDDLVRFDARSARERILLLDTELEEIETTLSSHHEELGSLRQEVQVLESSRASHADFFRRAGLSTEIYRAAEAWFALQLEHDTLQDMRQRFEQENISGTLVTASLYMHRMTSGRYHRIWAPLGEDFLCIDDEYGQTCRVEQLSGGTREQLFLAIRFALVREFARRGMELPVIMDDLFVNFDQERTEAAADCLIELADEGQQVLFFTCHEHLAELFRQKQVEPLWLPGHKVAVDLHKPELEVAGQTGRVDEPAGSPQGPVSPGSRFVVDSDDLLDDDESRQDVRSLRESG